jgi:hydrogenase maturation protease
MTILVLGIGSPFADDQAGWLVADQLSHVEGLQGKIQSGELIIVADDRPGLNLLDWLGRDYEHIHLVDMVKTNLAETGNTYILQAKEIIGFSGMLSSHNLGVSPSLALAEVLGIKISHVTFWGIEGERYQPHEEISPEMLLAIAKVTGQIQDHLLK